ncbi:hypothetical protein ABH922_000440 [Rhodococcus sp. 27YEA15]
MAGGAFDECSDGGGVVLADDEVTVPMAGYGSVFDLGRSVADHHHRVAVPRLPLSSLASRLPAGSARVQCCAKLTAQPATTRDAEAKVDRFVGRVHLRVVGEIAPQGPGDLFHAPPTAGAPTLRPLTIHTDDSRRFTGAVPQRHGLAELLAFCIQATRPCTISRCARIEHHLQLLMKSGAAKISGTRDSFRPRYRKAPSSCS